MRIILADHHEKPRWALSAFLEEQPEFQLVGVSADAQELLVTINEHEADLVLMDRELPGSPFRDLITRLHALQPRPIVIVMSTEIEYSQVSLKAGADAFVSKGDHPEWLLEKLHQYEKSG